MSPNKTTQFGRRPQKAVNQTTVDSYTHRQLAAPRHLPFIRHFHQNYDTAWLQWPYDLKIFIFRDNSKYVTEELVQGNKRLCGGGVNQLSLMRRRFIA